MAAPRLGRREWAAPARRRVPQLGRGPVDLTSNTLLASRRADYLYPGRGVCLLSLRRDFFFTFKFVASGFRTRTQFPIVQKPIRHVGK